MKNFERGAQKVPGEKSPAEESPEEIKRKKRGILGMIVSDAMAEGIDTEKLNQLGGEVTANLDLLEESDLGEAYEKAGTAGLEILKSIIEKKKADQATEGVSRDIEILKSEQDALGRKNGEGRAEEGQPHPELKRSAPEEDVGEKSNP